MRPATLRPTEAQPFRAASMERETPSASVDRPFPDCLLSLNSNLDLELQPV